MTYQEIIEIMHNIANSSCRTKKIPMKIKLPLLYNIDKCSSTIQKWNSCLNELLERYCNKDENGNPIIINENYDIKKEFVDEYNSEFNDIITSDSFLKKSDLQKIPINYFDQYDEDKFDILTLQDIQALQFMIDMG